MHMQAKSTQVSRLGEVETCSKGLMTCGGEASMCDAGPRSQVSGGAEWAATEAMSVWFRGQRGHKILNNRSQVCVYVCVCVCVCAYVYTYTSISLWLCLYGFEARGGIRFWIIEVRCAGVCALCVHIHKNIYCVYVSMVQRPGGHTILNFRSQVCLYVFICTHTQKYMADDGTLRYLSRYLYIDIYIYIYPSIYLYIYIYIYGG